MSKQVSLKIDISKDGTIHVEPEGTQGSECLELMTFIDKLEGFFTLETIKNEDYKIKKVQMNTMQHVG
jgi:hypothetical protein